MRQRTIRVMTGKPRASGVGRRYLRWLMLGGLALGGCGKPAFPARLFTVEAADGDYPMMLSRVPGAGKGRSISAESGTHVAVSQSSYSTPTAHVTVTHTETAQSELPASEKLAARLRRRDKWVQIERCTFDTRLYTSYGYGSSDQLLTIEAEAHSR